MKTLIWANRGASGYAPENSMEAFKLAKDQGADGIKLEIHLTKDGQLVVAHDETIDRCSNGTGCIIDMTLKELRTYDFSNSLPDHKNTKIPTLEEVLCFIKNNDMTVNIEFNSGIVIYDGIEEKVVSLVAQLGLKSRVLYSSFNHFSLMLIKEIDKTIPVGLLYNEAMVDPYVYASHLKADAVHPFYPALFVPNTVRNCKTNGIKVHPWTVNNPEHMDWIYKEGVNAIITDYPDLALRIREQINSK